MTLAPFTSADLLDAGRYQTSKAAERADSLAAKLRQRRQRADFSTHSQSPVEKPAHGVVCGTVHLHRLADGRLRAQRLDCRTKRCPRCGPRLRAEYAMGYTTVLATAGLLYRLQLPDSDWRKTQASIKRQPGAQVLRIPAPAGQLVIYTTVDLGHLVDAADLADLVASDFAAMPSDRRNVSASKDWRHAYHAWRDQQTPATTPSGEWLGILGRPLEHVAMIAADLGMLVAEVGNHSLVLADPPDPATWHRFCALARLRQPRQE